VTVPSNNAPTYGNWYLPKTRGLAGLNSWQTVVMIVGIFILVYGFNFWGFIPAIIIALIDLTLLWLFKSKDKHGYERSIIFSERFNYFFRKKDTIYQSGIMGKTKLGKCKLPGIPATSELKVFNDLYGKEFCLIFMPEQGTFALVLSAEPNGSALVDSDQVDTWVYKYGQFINNLGNEFDLIGMTVTVDTKAVSDEDFKIEITNRLKNVDPSSYAYETMKEIRDTYPQMGYDLSELITLVFAINGRKVNEIAEEMASRIPNFLLWLSETGVGAAYSTPAGKLIEFIRTVYDPEIAKDYAEAIANGEEIAVSWDDVGPTLAKAKYAYYEHDSGLSKTWYMSIAPKGVVHDNVLGSLLGYTDRLGKMNARKRISLVYRTYDAAESVKVVEKDLENTGFNAFSEKKNRVSAEKRREIAKVERNSENIAAGNGLVGVGLVATITVPYDSEIKPGEAIIENLAASSRILLRPAYGCQDSAFAQNLPLGVMLNHYNKVFTGTKRNTKKKSL
jgi:hypothetical protein